MAAPLLRQSVILGGLSWTAFSVGFVYGQLSGMIGALQKNEDDNNLSENEIAMIASSINITALLGFLFAAFSTEAIGIKRSMIISLIALVVHWIILYYARDMLTFILSKIAGGIGVGSAVGLYTCSTAEYTSPKTRPVFLTLTTTVSPAIGTTFGHLLGFMFHWRNVCLFGLLFSVITVFLPLFWVESPHWLASKGRFDECQASFKKIHNLTAESNRELVVLLKVERCKLEEAGKHDRMTLSKRLKFAVRSKYFWELMSLVAALFFLLAAAGKGIFGSLLTVVLEKITGTSHIEVYTLVVDGSTILGCIIACVLTKRTSMRILLFSTGILSILLLVILSACIYFKPDDFQWIIVILLAVYFILFYAGPYPVIEAVAGEIFPSDIKLFCLCISVSIFITLISLSITLLPHIVSLMGYHGLFLLMAALMSLSLLFLWMKMPETKGKTLQEIEVYFKTKNFEMNLDDEIKSTLI